MNLQLHKRQLIVLMTLLFFVSQATTDIYVPGLPSMTRELHTTLKHMTMTITIYTYAQAFFFLFIGVLSDLFGRRKILLPGILLQIIASLLISRCNSVEPMVLLRIVQAIGSAAIYIVLRLVIKDVMSRQEQIAAVGVFVTALPLSLALAPVIGAWLIHFWGWRACFSLVGVVQLALWVWAFFLLQESNQQCHKFRAEFRLKSHFQGYWQVLQEPLFITQAIIIGGVFSAYYAFISISSYMYIDQYHVASTVYSYTFIGIAIAYLLGNRIMLWLNRENVSPWQLIQIGVVISLAGLLAMLAGMFFHHSSGLILGLVTLGAVLLRMATAFINPPIQVSVTHHFGDRGAHALGLLSCSQYIFGGIGSWIVSLLPYKPSISLVIASLALTALSFVGYHFCPRQRIA